MTEVQARCVVSVPEVGVPEGQAPLHHLPSLHPLEAGPGEEAGSQGRHKAVPLLPGGHGQAPPPLTALLLPHSGHLHNSCTSL